VAISQPFSVKGHVSVNIYLKAEGAFENFKKPPVAPLLGQIYQTK
jgi:hypothetical protein